MKNTLPVLLALALGHGLNDFIAGFLLAKSVEAAPALWGISLFAIYSALAFGGQVPLALLIEKKKNYRAWALLAFALMGCAIALQHVSMIAAIIVSGFASALYHVAGGALSIQLPKAKTFSAGIFSAPGVIGLTLGGFFIGKMEFDLLWLLPALLLFAFFVFRLKRFQAKENVSEKSPAEKTPGFEVHDGIMLLLLLVIALRSAIWDIYQVVYYESPQWMLWIALAAAAGKALGGLLAERYDKVNYLGASMFSSIVLLQFSEKHPAFLLAGIALLQSTIPACVMLVSRFLGGQYGMSNAIVLGLAIVIGAFPYQFPGEYLFYWVSAGLAFSLLVFYLLMRKRLRSSNSSNEKAESAA